MPNVISKSIEVYGNLRCGKNVRIDDGCIFTGDVEIGDYVHIAPYCVFHAGAGIKIGSFSGFSAFSTFHTACDDFTGETLFGPTVPEHLKNVKEMPMEIGEFVIFGVKASVVSVPRIPDGVALGGHSMLLSEPDPWSVYAGSPARRVGPRNKACSVIARELREPR